MSDIKIQELLTRKEVEKILKISRSQIYNLLKSGKLTAYKIGGSLRFLKDDISNLIKATPYVKKTAANQNKKPAQPLKEKEEIPSEIKKEGLKEDKGTPVPKNSFEEALKFTQELNFLIDTQEQKYKLGDLLILDFKDFKNENPHIAANKLKQHFKKVLLSKFSLENGEIEEIFGRTEHKFKEFGRKIFIRNMQQNGGLYSGWRNK